MSLFFGGPPILGILGFLLILDSHPGQGWYQIFFFSCNTPSFASKKIPMSHLVGVDRFCVVQCPDFFQLGGQAILHILRVLKNRDFLPGNFFKDLDHSRRPLGMKSGRKNRCLVNLSGNALQTQRRVFRGPDGVWETQKKRQHKKKFF